MQIFELSREQYEYFELHYTYVSHEHYVPSFSDKSDCFTVSFRREQLPSPYRHDSYDAMYGDWTRSTAYGLSLDGGKSFVGYMECEREEWNSRLRIANLLILEPYRSEGYGTALVEHAKNLAQTEDFRCVFLETQSCNVPAIDFYRKCGFRFAGTNLYFYSNEDIEDDEVMLEMIYIPPSN